MKVYLYFTPEDVRAPPTPATSTDGDCVGVVIDLLSTVSSLILNFILFPYAQDGFDSSSTSPLNDQKNRFGCLVVDVYVLMVEVFGIVRALSFQASMEDIQVQSSSCSSCSCSPFSCPPPPPPEAI